MCSIKGLLTILLATFVLVATDAVANKSIIYRWVDEQGLVHYGDRPGDSSDIEIVQIRSGKTYSTAPVFDSDEEPIYPAQAEQATPQSKGKAKRQSAAERKAEMAAACKQRREAIARIEPVTKVLVEGEDGEVYRMDDNDRLKLLAESKAFIADNCDK